jgi:hypothetical protein
MDLSTVSQYKFNQIAGLLNGRLRRTLGWRTPNEASPRKYPGSATVLHLTLETTVYRLLGAMVLARTGDLEPIVAMAVESEVSSAPVRRKFAGEIWRVIDQMIQLPAECERSGG